MFYGFFGLGGVPFKPEKDIPDLSGKVILVTGGKLSPDPTQGSIISSLHSVLTDYHRKRWIGP